MDVFRFILVLATSILESSNMERREYLLNSCYGIKQLQCEITWYMLPNVTTKCEKRENDRLNNDTSNVYVALLFPLNLWNWATPSESHWICEVEQHVTWLLISTRFVANKRGTLLRKAGDKSIEWWQHQVRKEMGLMAIWQCRTTNILLATREFLFSSAKRLQIYHKTSTKYTENWDGQAPAY